MKDTSVIPKGMYCYDKNGQCPYHKILPDRPHQYNGWCDYLEKGDIEINKEDHVIVYTKELGECNIPIEDEDGLGFPVGLLWDSCKECGINEELDDETEH